MVISNMSMYQINTVQLLGFHFPIDCSGCSEITYNISHVTYTVRIPWPCCSIPLGGAEQHEWMLFNLSNRPPSLNSAFRSLDTQRAGKKKGFDHRISPFIFILYRFLLIITHPKAITEEFKTSVNKIRTDRGIHINLLMSKWCSILNAS